MGWHCVGLGEGRVLSGHSDCGCGWESLGSLSSELHGLHERLVSTRLLTKCKEGLIKRQRANALVPLGGTLTGLVHRGTCVGDVPRAPPAHALSISFSGGLVHRLDFTRAAQASH